MDVLMEKFIPRVFKIFGALGHGTGVLMGEGIIYTVAHLGFVIGSEYVVSGSGGRDLPATCSYISNSCDLAFLQLEDKNSQKLLTGNLYPGYSYCFMGYPSSSHSEAPSILKTEVEGLNIDGTHYLGIPGAPPGYSGAPVFSRFGGISGLITGGYCPHKDSQAYCCILPMTTINTCKRAVSDNDSVEYYRQK